MTAKYSFRLQSQEKQRALPDKLILGQDSNETVAHVILKLLAFVLFHRERLQIGGDLHNDNLPFAPDLMQLDYEIRPKLWIDAANAASTNSTTSRSKCPKPKSGSSKLRWLRRKI